MPMLNLIKEVLKFLSPFVLVVAFYAVIYGVRRLQGKNKPGDWKPRAVPFEPGEITRSISDDDDSDSSSSSGGSSGSGGGSFGGGGASGQW
jgi:uncharacterized membrane protein YgcG